ncbi:hypothetical protein BH23ACT9_BH23ACT9_14840 [soil metagenome]
MSRRHLTERERALLEFERRWTGQRGGKGRAIQAAFAFSPSRYYQLIAELIDHPAAESHDPLLVRRLRRRRRERLGRTMLPGLADQSDRGVTK